MLATFSSELKSMFRRMMPTPPATYGRTGPAGIPTTRLPMTVMTPDESNVLP